MTERVALVTGANGSPGNKVTKALLETGAKVVGLAPKSQQSDFDHPNFTALPAALDSLNAAHQATQTVIGRFGKIDVLAHLVGGFAGCVGYASRNQRSCLCRHLSGRAGWF
jgi:NAD(P)-dependent dehydrogenase (short-subunit alcohol dehydrogenase family)